VISNKNISLISIIIPCYNQAQYLPETLQSVLDQTYTNWECVIVNDGSPDNTEEVALEWTKKDQRFKYFKKLNGGLADARNYGIKASSGEYILPLDSDDLIAATYLEKAVTVFESHEDIGIVYSDASFFDGTNGVCKTRKHNLKRILLFNTMFCTSFFRRKDFDLTNGYNTNMVYGYEDWDFWLTLTTMGIKAYKIPEYLFFYRIRSNSMLRSIDKQKRTLLHYQIINNHLDLYKSNFRNPYILAEYYKYRENLTGETMKDLIFLIKNINIPIFRFFIKRKFSYYFSF
jgi:glycosyltransferase involved in cell wall biosynthesis